MKFKIISLSIINILAIIIIYLNLNIQNYSVRVEEFETTVTQLQDDLSQLNNSIKESENDINYLMGQVDSLQTYNTELEVFIEGMNMVYSVLSGTMILPQSFIDDSKVVYLTFDDGPSQNTLKILDILKSHDIKATFFVNYKPNMEHAYKRIIEEGSVIGNHTYSHKYDEIYKSVETFFSDIDKLNDYIYELTGFRPNVIRFPGGSDNTVSQKYGGKEIMKEILAEARNREYLFYDWNVVSGDADSKLVPAEKIIDNVKKRSKDKNTAVVLMHDLGTKVTTVEALNEIIIFLKEQGYIFKTL